MRQRFFPLDKKLGLLSGKYTPEVQEAIVRLGGRLTYGEVQDEIKRLWGIKISKGGVRAITMRHGRAATELVEQKVKQLQEADAVIEQGTKQLVMCADGAMIHLTNGEWAEVKTVAFGEFESNFNYPRGKNEIKAKEISYFSQMISSDRFAENSVVEWHRRGGADARRVVAVNDGAAWIQSFIDYHCPKAIRVLDFPHAQEYVAQIGKSIYGANTEPFTTWFEQKSKQLATKPPDRVLNDLRLLLNQHQDHPERDTLDQSMAYLERRKEMIDYPHFRKIGVPIGSGIGESAHKVVMQRRMKQAGMRWHPDSVNPMLALRTAICNRVWDSTWEKIHCHSLEKKRDALSASAKPTPASVESRIITEDDCLRLEKFAQKNSPLSRSHLKWQNHNDIFQTHPKPLRQK